jgi:AraC-like DNA-binding protein
MPSPGTFETSNRTSHPLIRLSLITPFLDRLKSLGISSEKSLKRLGLTFDMANNPDVFVHSEVFYGLMNELARAGHDPFLGLHVAEDMDLDEWPVLATSLETSRTVGEFLFRFVQNVPKHYTSAEHALLVGADRSQYRFKRVRQPSNSAAQLDGFAAGLYLRIFEAAASKVWVRREITLRTAYPDAIPPFYREAMIEAHSDAAFVIEFPTEILFEDIAFDQSRIRSSTALLTRPTLVSAIRAVAPRLLTQKRDLSRSIADALGLSVNSMEKTLIGEGTSLSREIKILKCEMACEMLANTDASIADVGTNIGYSEPANFTRFFKSQLDMTPNQYRKIQQHERSQ